MFIIAAFRCAFFVSGITGANVPVPATSGINIFAENLSSVGLGVKNPARVDDVLPTYTIPNPSLSSVPHTEEELRAYLKKRMGMDFTAEQIEEIKSILLEIEEDLEPSELQAIIVQILRRKDHDNKGDERRCSPLHNNVAKSGTSKQIVEKTTGTSESPSQIEKSEASGCEVLIIDYDFISEIRRIELLESEIEMNEGKDCDFRPLLEANRMQLDRMEREANDEKDDLDEWKISAAKKARIILDELEKKMESWIKESEGSYSRATVATCNEKMEKVMKGIERKVKEENPMKRLKYILLVITVALLLIL